MTHRIQLRDKTLSVRRSFSPISDRKLLKLTLLVDSRRAEPVWQTANMFLGETCCLIAFSLINSRLNPFRKSERRKATAAAREAALASNSARLRNDPLSRPDESAYAFTNSAISLQGPDVEAGANHKRDGKIEHAHEEESRINWKDAAMFWGPACCDIAGTTCMNVGLFFVP